MRRCSRTRSTSPWSTPEWAVRGARSCSASRRAARWSAPTTGSSPRPPTPSASWRPSHSIPCPTGAAATFHGRDLFAPAAAALAGGARPAGLGIPFDPASLLVPDLPAPDVRPGALVAPIVAVDAFGNLELLAGAADLAAAGFTMGDRISAAVTDRRHPATVCRVFADAAPKGMLVHVDSHGMVALAVNGGSAARRMGAAAGQTLTLARWTSP